jgi:periplasmic divalent cation tolerance protein
VTDKIVVFSTCSTIEEAERIAQRLVNKRLAGCVNIIGRARSVYRWRGAVEQTSECILIIKSRRDLFDSLRVELEKAHSYEVPEVIALTVVDGAAGYLHWLDGELASEGD